ncbi:hypothetical protein KKE34_03960 [Patescibacteria group bacterium]|nr:hypothetical protein [Patescibacteria group bacterium]MBU1885735.1 hypothetical protein [Patescibacteria group bacterium]
MNLYPSILTSSLIEFKKQLTWIAQSQVVEVIQIDIIDGYFADNFTLTPSDLIQVDYGELRLDFHLMTQEPIDFVQEMVPLKEHLPVRAIIAQVERMSSQGEFFQEVKKHTWKAGLSLDLYTPVEAIDPESWPELDIVQLMTIKYGFQGQEFNQNALEKITEIRQQLINHDLEIIIDGGVKKEQLNQLLKNKIGGVTVGSGFWKSDDPVGSIIKYSQLIEQAGTD